MLRTAPSRLLRQSIRCSTRVLRSNRRSIPPFLRYYADKKPPSDDERVPRVSDYVANQSSPTNPETPVDRMPHQTEEDIAMERIFGGEPHGTKDGLPEEGVPVEEVFNKDPEAMEQAPAVIKESETEGSTSGDVRISAEQTLPHVTEETIATERIISGENVTGASSSVPGEETPAEAVPIEEVISDSEKPAVMEESSKDDDEPPPPAPQVKTRGASRTASFGKRKLPSSSSAKTPQNSILDLFGPRTKSPKQTRKRVLETAPVVTADDLKAPVEAEKEANPLTSRNLDGSNTDLADWERDPAVQKWNTEKEFASINEWADSRRWQYEAEKQRVRDQSTDPRSQRTRSEIVSEEQAKSIQKRAQDRAALVDYAQRQYDHIHVPPSKSGTPVEFFDQRVRTDPQEPSPWDYFYPPSQLGKPLRTLQAEEAEDTDPYASLLPDAAAKAKKSAVYDPYAKPEKKMKWPFQFNRDELVSKCVNLIMRNGKKATAEKVMQDMFMALMEKYPRQHPVTVFADAIDQNAPLAKTVTFKTGTKLAVVPFALFERQRIRAGMMVLMKAAEKDYTTPLGIKLAKEVIKTMERNGPGVPFRLAEHKRAMQNKLAIKLPSTRKKV